MFPSKQKGWFILLFSPLSIYYKRWICKIPIKYIYYINFFYKIIINISFYRLNNTDMSPIERFRIISFPHHINCFQEYRAISNIKLFLKLFLG